MSLHTVDLLHEAEDHIGVLESQLFRIWMALNFPPDESASDTFDAIAEIMESAGWTGLPRSFTEAVAEQMSMYPEIESIEERWPRQWAKLKARHTPGRYQRIEDVDDV